MAVALIINVLERQLCISIASSSTWPLPPISAGAVCDGIIGVPSLQLSPDIRPRAAHFQFRIRIPAPSPIRNVRSRSNGREAVCGSSLRVERAVITS